MMVSNKNKFRLKLANRDIKAIESFITDNRYIVMHIMCWVEDLFASFVGFFFLSHPSNLIIQTYPINYSLSILHKNNIYLLS